MLKFLGDKNRIVDATSFCASIFSSLCFVLASSLFVVILSLISSLLFNSSNVSAYTASLSTSGTVTTNVTPNTEGDKSISINQDSVNVITDCRAGYNLTISSSVTDRNLYKDGNSANNTSGQYFTPVNGTAQLNNTTNQYGYSLTANTESGVFTPLPLPSAPTFIKTPSQTASESDIDDDISVYYGVSTANTVSPGLYKMPNNGYVLYQLTLDDSCRSYTVAFNANGGTGTMTNQDVTVDQAINIKANSFTAPARGQSYQNADGNTIPAIADKMWAFWGWNTEVDGSGDWYKDRESVTNLANDGDTITFYAQWKQATLADLTASTPGQNKTIDHNTMQDMSSATCWNSDKFTAIGTPYGQATLVDTRDGNTRTYTVARLPDGYCWMTQNLNLGTSTPITLTSNDTDLEEGTTFTLPASDPNDFATSSGSANVNKATVLNDMTIPDYTVNGTTYSGKVTGYYSYAAATADTSTYSKSSATEVTTSICPKNWDLPTNTQYYDLRTKGSIATYNNTTASYEGKNAGNEPYYFIYGGYRRAAGSEVNTTNFYNPTTYGYLWTANNYGSSSGRGTYVYSSGLYNSSAGTTYSKYYGLGVRCISNMDEVMAKITFVNTETGETQTQIIGLIGENNTITLQQHPAIWTKSNYSIAGWDTNDAGTNVVYTKGQSVTLSDDITLYTVWKPAYNIQYDGNGADEGVMTNVKHTSTFEGDTFDLFASNYSKANYGFVGWSFDQNAQPGGSSRIYGPNETIIAPAASMPGETKTLYAVWIQSAGNLQDWNGCSNMNIGDVTALKDTRDNQVYTVGKLADGNCWMTENLRLNNTAIGNSDASLAQGYGGVFAGLADPEGTSSFYSATTPNSLYTVDDSSTTLNIIVGSNLGYRFPRYDNTNTDSRDTNPSIDDDRAIATSAHVAGLTSAIYSYGNYYTWAAAKANTEDLATSAVSEAANTSICPSGWKLPYGGSSNNSNASGGFYYLSAQLGATASNVTSARIWRGYPNNFVYAGQKGSGLNSQRGTGGYYLSASSYNDGNPYSMYIGPQTIIRNETSNKYYGKPIRCLAEDGLGVKLMLNDGTNRVGGRVYGKAGSTVTLPNINRKEGYYLAGWNTAADGSGTQYTSSYTFSPSATTGITLYAQLVVTDCPAGKICYDTNGNNVEGTMGQQTISNTDTSVTLMPSNFSRSGYGFAGWNTKADGTGISYGPNETIEFSAGAFQFGGLKLYAMWVQSAGNLQSWGECNNLAVGAVTALTDQRDNQTYTVARLADGKCWMVENLRLEANNSGNSNYAQGFGGVFSGLATAEPDTNFDNSTTSNSKYSDSNITGSYQAYRFPRYNNVNTQSRASSPTSANASIFSYGNYYSWAAARANTEHLINDVTLDTVNTSICPAGWRLPNGTNFGDYSMLSNSLGGYKDVSGAAQAMNSSTIPTGAEMSKVLRSFPNNFLYSGGIGGTGSSGSLVGRGYMGSYWTSTSSTVTADYFNIGGNTSGDLVVRPNASSGAYVYSSKYNGYLVRCVADQSNTGSTRITFNKNNSSATGSMSVQTINAGTSTALTTNGFSSSGYVFNGWNTKADGSGISYADEGAYYAIAGNETNNATLYAQWDQLVTITFSLDSNTTGINFDGTTYTNGQTTQAIVGKEYTIISMFNTKYGVNSWSATAGTIANNTYNTTTYTPTESSATISVTAKEATVSISSLTNPSTPVSSNCKNEAVVPELVYDPRDNEAYYVARLCDGKYWMLDNLRLDLTNSTVINNLTSSNTNATATQLDYLKNGGGTATDQYPTAGLTGSGWVSSYYYSVPQINNNFKDIIAPVVYGVGSSKLGIYYNYCAASAGSYCWGNRTDSIGSPTTDPRPSSYRDIEGDICPAGWRLPTGGANDGSDYRYLYSVYNGSIAGQNVAMRNALSWLLSGNISNDSSSLSDIGELGVRGRFQSSSWGSQDNMFTRTYNSSSNNGSFSDTSLSRTTRVPIRCVR